MAKHKVALYRDGKQVRRIRYEHLTSPKALELARSHKLFNPTWEFRLFVRGGASPHFFSLATRGRRSTDRQREAKSGHHDDRITYLLGELKGIPMKRTIEVGTNAWKDLPEGEDPWVAIAEIKSYDWQKEVTRALSGASRCRHDLFGSRAQDLNLTGRHPWIAIEVIHEHYPNEATFSGLLTLSVSMPLVVLFDLATAGNYFLKVDSNLRRIRARFYIYNGCLWENDTNHGNQVSAEAFKAMVLRVRGK
jgi:hypothetical protein